MDNTARAAVRCGHPLMLWGAPGCGKSSWAVSGDRPHVQVSAAALPLPSDIVGMVPDLEAGIMRQLPTALFSPLSAGWLLVIDDLPDALPMTLRSLYDLVQHGRIGEHRLTGVQIICTGNPASSNATGASLPPALSNRLVHIECAEQLAGYPEPPPAERRPDPVACAEWRGVIGLYARDHRPKSADDPDGYGRAPSARTLDMLADLLASGADVLPAAIATVGPSYAAGLAAWLTGRKIPSLADLLAGRAKMPDRLDQQWAILRALLTMDTHTPEVWGVLAQSDQGVARAFLPSLRRLIETCPPTAAGKLWLAAEAT